MALRAKLRRLPRKSKRLVRKFFGRTLQRTSYKTFAYQINVKAKQQRFRRNSKRGKL